MTREITPSKKGNPKGLTTYSYDPFALVTPLPLLPLFISPSYQKKRALTRTIPFLPKKKSPSPLRGPSLPYLNLEVKKGTPSYPLSLSYLNLEVKRGDLVGAFAFAE